MTLHRCIYKTPISLVPLKPSKTGTYGVPQFHPGAMGTQEYVRTRDPTKVAEGESHVLFPSTQHPQRDGTLQQDLTYQVLYGPGTEDCGSDESE